MKFTKIIMALYKETDKHGLLSALFYAILIIYYRTKSASFELNSMAGRYISSATAENFDIAARVTFYFVNILLLLVLIFVFLVGINWIKKKINIESMRLVSYHAAIGLAILATQVAGFETAYAFKIILALHLCMALFIVFKSFYKAITPNMFRNDNYLIFVVFGISLATPVLTYYINIVESPFYTALTIATFTSGVIAFFFVSASLLKRLSQRFISVLWPIALLPLLYVLSTELYLILNNKGIIFLSPFKLYVLLIGLIFILICVRFFSRASSKDTFHINKTYPLIITVFLSGIIAVIFYNPILPENTELYELANPYLSVQQFYEFGKIPFYDNFNVHALHEIFFKFLFSFINGYNGMVFEHYDFLLRIIWAIIAFRVLKELLNNAFAAFIFLLLFPIMEAIMPFYFNISLLPALALISMHKKPCFKTYLYFFASVILLILWRIDLGYAALIASATTLCVLLILDKNNLWKPKPFIKAVLIITGLLILLISPYLIHGGSKVIHSLQMILNYLSSAQSYGIKDLTWLSKDLIFNLHIFIIPTLAIISLVWATFSYKKVFDNKGLQAQFFIALTYIIIFYVANYQRGIIRHGFIEGSSKMLSSYAFLWLSASALMLISSNNVVKKTISFSIIALVLSFGFQYPAMGTSDNCYIESYFVKLKQSGDFSTQNQKIDRIIKNPEFENAQFGYFKTFLNENFSQNQTFGDFSNTPMLYYHTHRINPNFFNQTLLTCHNDFLQQQYINEIKAADVPVFIFSNYPNNWWDATDGIANTTRFYMISEFIYQNYKPFAIINNRTIWLSKDLCSEHIDTLVLPEPIQSVKQETGIYTEINLRNLALQPINKKNIYIFIENKHLESAQITNTDETLYKINVSEAKDYGCYIKIDTSQLHLIKNLQIPDSICTEQVKVIASNYLPDFYSQNYKADVSLGLIPYLWGKYDKAYLNGKFTKICDISSKEELVDENHKYYSLPLKLIQDKTATYIAIEAKANQNITKTFLRFGLNNKWLGGFAFTIKNDNFAMYLVRVSTNYNWYANQVDWINLSSEKQSITVKSISILKEN